MTDLAKIADDLSGLTVLEAAELAKMLEEKWGVSASAAVAVAAAPGAAAGGDAAEEEKTEFTVLLKAAGDKKINVIKEVRGITEVESNSFGSDASLPKRFDGASAYFFTHLFD